MSEPIYGQWFNVAEVPITTDPDAWIVTAQRRHERAFSDGAPVNYTYTGIRAFLPGRVHAHSEALGHPPAERAEVWMRIPPPPWLTQEGK